MIERGWTGCAWLLLQHVPLMLQNLWGCVVVDSLWLYYLLTSLGDLLMVNCAKFLYYPTPLTKHSLGDITCDIVYTSNGYRLGFKLYFNIDPY